MEIVIKELQRRKKYKTYREIVKYCTILYKVIAWDSIISKDNNFTSLLLLLDRFPFRMFRCHEILKVHITILKSIVSTVGTCSVCSFSTPYKLPVLCSSRYILHDSCLSCIFFFFNTIIIFKSDKDLILLLFVSIVIIHFVETVKYLSHDL